MTVERRGHVLLMGLNRPAKRNAFNLAMIDQLAAAYTSSRPTTSPLRW